MDVASTDFGEAFTDGGERFTKIGVGFCDFGKNSHDVGESFTEIAESLTDVGVKSLVRRGALVRRLFDHRFDEPMAVVVSAAVANVTRS